MEGWAAVSNRTMLTVKQERFITNYVATGNATQSAISAGYPPKSAHSIATENLLKPAIIARRTELEAQINSPLVADAEEIRQKLTEIVRDEYKAPITAMDKVRASAELSKLGGFYAPEKHLIAEKIIFEVVHIDRKRIDAFQE